MTSRLLLEAGDGGSVSQWNQFWQPGAQAKTVSTHDLGLGIQYGASATYRGHPNYTNRFTQRFSATYVTGSHTFKTGIQMEELFTDNFIFANGNVNYTFRNGVPVSVTQRTTPYLEQEGARAGALRPGSVAGRPLDVQSTACASTTSYGYVPGAGSAGPSRRELRSTGSPACDRRHVRNQWIGPTPFRRSQRHPVVEGYQPAAGASRTTSSATDGPRSRCRSAGYVAKTNVDVSQPLNPINTSVNSARRARGPMRTRTSSRTATWAISPRMANAAPSNNQFFGQTNPNAIRWADEVLKGWGVRDNNWDFSAEVQHELTRGTVPDGRLLPQHRRLLPQHRQQAAASDNILVTPGRLRPYCITAPSDPRLPGGGGYPICGLADSSRRNSGRCSRSSALRDFGEDKRTNDFIGVRAQRAAAGRRPGGRRLRHRPHGQATSASSSTFGPDGFNRRQLRPADRDDHSTESDVPRRHAVQGPDAGEAEWQRAVAKAVRGQRRLPGHVRHGHRGGLGRDDAVIAPSLGRNLAGGAVRQRAAGHAADALRRPDPAPGSAADEEIPG